MACIVGSAGVAHASPEAEWYRPGDCRYVRDGGEATRRWRAVALPSSGVFRPLLADVKEPRAYASLHRMRFRTAQPGGGDRRVNAGLIAVGGSFGLWSMRRGCDGIQIGVSGGVFSQFNLDRPSRDLINTDFIGGLPITARYGPWSARVRIYHQSSHLGDEFVLHNTEVERVPLSFEAVDGVLSVSSSFWRLYVGGGYVVHSIPEIAPRMVRGGLELRGLGTRRTVEGARVQPVAGVDVNAREERRWELTTSVKGGVAISGPNGRRARLLVAYLHGYFPFSQFFATKQLWNLGLEAQLDF